MASNKSQLVVSSNPELFEPFTVDAWTVESADRLVKVLRTQKGNDRGDLILLLAKRELDDIELPRTCLEKALGKDTKTVKLVEWYSAVFRWDGEKWESVFPGNSPIGG